MTKQEEKKSFPTFDSFPIVSNVKDTPKGQFINVARIVKDTKNKKIGFANFMSMFLGTNGKPISTNFHPSLGINSPEMMKKFASLVTDWKDDTKQCEKKDEPEVSSFS